MSASKLIVVVGATGNQGGSVVNTFLDESGWKVRGVTRDASSPKALSLKSRGVEVVQADMDEPASLAKVFTGANAIFAVSDFWTIIRPMMMDPQSYKDDPDADKPVNERAKAREAQQLKNVIDAAAQVSTLDRFIISSLPNVIELSGGKYTNVCHFDSKAVAADYARDTYPGLWAKTSLYKAGFFLSNMVGDPAGTPTQKEDGTVQMRSWLDVDLKLPFIWHDEDSGPFVKALINEPAGKNLIAYREWLSGREIMQIFTEVTGYKAEAIQVPPGEFWFPCPPELQPEFEEFFAYINEYGYEGRNDPGLIHPRDLASPPKFGPVGDFFKKQDWPKIFASQKSA